MNSEEVLFLRQNQLAELIRKHKAEEIMVNGEKRQVTDALLSEIAEHGDASCVTSIIGGRTKLFFAWR